jgi:hypothetical protein
MSREQFRSVDARQQVAFCSKNNTVGVWLSSLGLGARGVGIFCLMVLCASRPLGATSAEWASNPDREWVLFDAGSAEIREFASSSKVPSMAVSDDESSLNQLTRMVRQQHPRTLHIVAHGRSGAVLDGGQGVDHRSLHASSCGRSSGASVEHIVFWSCRTGADERSIQTLERLIGALV